MSDLMDRQKRRALFKTIAFGILAPGSVIGLIPYLLHSPRADFHLGTFRLLGILPVAVGASALLWCMWEFVSIGLGTPAPIDPPKVLLARGLYQFVRNPMYVAVFLILAGEAVYFESFRLAAYALFAALACHLFVVFYEEPTLRKKFGVPYLEYCKAVPRWIPRLTPQGPRHSARND